MQREDRNPDDDRSYCRPRAWAKAKAAFGPNEEAGKALWRLEREVPHCCPRLMLATAIHFLLTHAKTEAAQWEAIKAYCNDEQAARERPVKAAAPLPPGEVLSIDADFRDAMRKIFGDDLPPDWPAAA